MRVEIRKMVVQIGVVVVFRLVEDLSRRIYSTYIVLFRKKKKDRAGSLTVWGPELGRRIDNRLPTLLLEPAGES